MSNERRTSGGVKIHPREIMFAVNGLSRIIQQDMRKVCEENGVPVGYRSLLFHLAHNDGCSQRFLAKKAGLQPSTVSIALDKMERDGYVYREKSENDLRAVRLHLTEKGKRIDKIIRERIAEMDKNFSSTVSPEEKELLISLLEKVTVGYCKEQGIECPPLGGSKCSNVVDGGMEHEEVV